MPLHDLKPGETLGLERGEVGVCIPVFGGLELFERCLDSVLAHTDPGVPILVCDDASPENGLRVLLEGRADGHGELWYLRQPANRGFVENVNTGFAALAPGDVVILNSDCEVAEGWLQGLRGAALSEVRVATATPLTNAGTIVSVPRRNQPAPELPPGSTLEEVAAEVRERSERLAPDLPTCIGHCVYVRRSALDLVGGFDPAFSPGYEEETDFSQRCLLYGLRHVLADDVFVLHHQSGSFGSGEQVDGLRRDHHLILIKRYPYFDEWVAEVSQDPFSPLAHSLALAGGSMGGTSVTIDGRCLIQNMMTGTALATLELLSALDLHTDLRLRIVVPRRLGAYARDMLDSRPSIEVVSVADAEAGRLEPTDVVHRPYQAVTALDTLLLRRLAHRVVVTQQDNIAYRNPAYFHGYEEWRQYRLIASAALNAADQVVFISRHGAQDARLLELIDEERINVIPLSIEHTLAALYPHPQSPAGMGRSGRQFLFCLGTDFLHKNRLFAIRLLEALLEAGLFEGDLVFAGPKVSAGSSSRQEAAYLAARPALAARVTDLGPVGEPEKQWLLAEAAAVVYPTTYEGFGLIPYEAARAGTPCLFASHTGLADHLSAELARLVPWDARVSAERVAPVLVVGPERDALVEGIQRAGTEFTSERLARAHAEVYQRALAAPSPRAAVIATETMRVQADLDQIYGDPLSRGLAGRHAVLPKELRRPVLAVATRPILRGTATRLYRLAYLLRHGRRLSRSDALNGRGGSRAEPRAGRRRR
jgi:GT2 family glycosyltransferase